MATHGVTLTYEDYAALPNDGRRYELHEGELSVTPAPTPRHQEVLGTLYRILAAFVESQGLGKVYIAPIDVILSPPTVVQPDLVFVARDRLNIISTRGIEGAPSFVAEVISPSSVQIDHHMKRQIYARYRVPFYWIVDSEQRSIEVYGLERDAYALLNAARPADATFRAEPFGGLEIDLASLWR